MTNVSDMIKIMEQLRGNRGIYRAFEDTMEAMAIAVSNSCDKRQFDKREARYMEIAKDYSREELDLMSQLLGMLASKLEAKRSDYLGEIFMQLDLGSNYNGQFFTPYAACQLMASLTIDRRLVQDAIDHVGYVATHEPSVGAGGMMLAAEEVMSSLGHPGHMYVSCVDIDIKTVHMAYLQLSLAGIPATVIHGNSLTLKQWSTWYTPAYILGGWKRRLGREHDDVAMVVPASAPVLDVQVPTAPVVAQLDLFWSYVMEPNLIILGQATRHIAQRWSCMDGMVMHRPEEPKKRRIQEERYHAMLGDISKQCEFFGQKRDLETVKRLLVDAFARVMAADGTPIQGWGTVLPSLDGSGVVQLGIQTRRFTVRQASEFIEYLLSWGAENDVRWSAPDSDIPESFYAR